MLLKGMGAKQLYHANTVATSCRFLQQSGLRSREFVEVQGLKQTPRYKDAAEYGVWNGIFLDTDDIHRRGGRAKGPNQYGPVLFMGDVEVLLQLPEGSDVSITKDNPSNWYDWQGEDKPWFQTVEEIKSHIEHKTFRVGDYCKSCVIRTPSGRLDFPKDNDHDS
jgi:hypothetical protein